MKHYLLRWMFNINSLGVISSVREVNAVFVYIGEESIRNERMIKKISSTFLLSDRYPLHDHIRFAISLLLIPPSNIKDFISAARGFWNLLVRKRPYQTEWSSFA